MWTTKVPGNLGMAGTQTRYLATEIQVNSNELAQNFR